MKAFSRLYGQLDETMRTNAKIEALTGYFRSAPPEDAIWAVSFLVGRKPKQVVPTRKLMTWAAQLAGIPQWLFEDCYDVVGDLAETITLVLPGHTNSTSVPLHVWVEEHLLPLRGKDEEQQRLAVIAAWDQMDGRQRFVWNKLVTGGFRVGVSQRLVVRALSACSGIDEAVLTHRLMGDWQPTRDYYLQIFSPRTEDADVSRPYPFYLAYPLDHDVEVLGEAQDWQAEWKWDGIRAQLVKREGSCFLWSRGEELITSRFPEIEAAGLRLPSGTVLDGEIIARVDNNPLPFSELQRRIGRKNLSKRILNEVPAVFVAYDLLESGGVDVRQKDLAWRYGTLTALVNQNADQGLILSPKVSAASWKELAELKDDSRSRGVEGLMLKRLRSPYGMGRRRGDWWKWKVDPFRVDAVLIYAQRGHGRRAGLYTDYTFAVWDDASLVPFAKAYSGLSDDEIRQVDHFIQRNTVDKFGPVRSVKPELVFEIAFEAIRVSSRHKSGVAVRFPRISRWRQDKKIDDADTLETIKALIQTCEGNLKEESGVTS
jgi:DNA ligase-1